MHAWIHSNLTYIFEQSLVIGETYEIKQFVVTPFIEKFKCINGDKHLIVTNMTTVCEVPISLKLLHEEIFDFTHFFNLTTKNIQDNHCIGISQNL